MRTGISWTRMETAVYEFDLGLDRMNAAARYLNTTPHTSLSLPDAMVRYRNILWCWARMKKRGGPRP